LPIRVRRNPRPRQDPFPARSLRMTDPHRLWEESYLSATSLQAPQLGVGFSSLASCSVTGDSVDCGVKFSGEASGFSLFVLMGVSGEATPTATSVPPSPTPVPAMPTATATPAPTATKTSVPPTSTSTSVPPTARRTATSAPVATAVVVAAGLDPVASEPTGGFPVAAVIGIVIVAIIALLAGASAYLWKSGQYQTLLSFWRRIKETGR
jgi:hypothetical protein